MLSLVRILGANGGVLEEFLAIALPLSETK